jgi:sugar O-acyltransferase (sialic acid O-acetyltransferase NeuD family)
MRKEDQLIIVGDSVFAQVAYEYFTHDSKSEVVAFSVESDYLKSDRLFGLPVVPFEQLQTLYSPAEHKTFVAVVFTQFNRLRTRLYQAATAKGYAPASYISSNAYVGRNAEIGAHCFICESCVIQSSATLGENVVLWSGNYVGHHALIKSNCFTLPHVVISEFAELGENCIVGPNSTVLNNVTVADDRFIEAGTLVSENI